MHFDGKMKSNRRKIERGLGILPYGNSTTQTIGKCGGFRLCHDTGSACYECYRHSRRVCRYFNVGEKRWWIFFLNDKNRIQYNDQCKKCVYECKGNLLKKVLPNTSLSVLWIKNVLSVAVRNRLVRNTQRNVSGNASK
jgi:hypothetical protein